MLESHVMEETRTIVLVALAICLLAIACPAQDSPSLGDLARQQRQQKEQAKATSNKPRKVITNDQLPERSNESSKSGKVADKDSVSTSATENGAKPSGEEAKSQILAEKNQISSLQAQIDELNQSIHFAPANCVANCVSWNERQVEEMQAQLEEQKKQLEEMQESARKLGYGSSVYDP
jgi:hypothetical protein